MTPRTRAIVVTRLHNPTGVGVSDDAIRELAKIADAQGAYVIVDGSTRPSRISARTASSIGARVALAPNVVALSA